MRRRRKRRWRRRGRSWRIKKKEKVERKENGKEKVTKFSLYITFLISHFFIIFFFVIPYYHHYLFSQILSPLHLLLPFVSSFLFINYCSLGQKKKNCYVALTRPTVTCFINRVGFYSLSLMSDLGEEFAKICIHWLKKALA